MSDQLERRITLRQLRIFTSVIEHGSFTRAADALSLTQPAVTHQMQALARAVGQPLLDPGSRSPVLTAAGRALHERAGRILAMVADAQEAMDDVAGLRAGGCTSLVTRLSEFTSCRMPWPPSTASISVSR